MAPTPDPLADLIAAAATGDRLAFRALYQATAPRLLAIAQRMLGRRDMAEEAVQDAFVAAWRAAASYDPALGSVQAWLSTIVRRRAIDRLRASPWRVQERESEGDIAIPPATGEQKLAVRECLEQIATNERLALSLVYYYGLSHSELSTRLSVPLGTAKSWVRRGLHAMKQCLEP